MNQEQFRQLQRNLAEAAKPVCEQLRRVGKLIEEINQREDFKFLAAWYRAREQVRKERES